MVAEIQAVSGVLAVQQLMHNETHVAHKQLLIDHGIVSNVAQDHASSAVDTGCRDVVPLNSDGR